METIVPRRTILFGVTSGITARLFLTDTLTHLNAHGCDVDLVLGALDTFDKSKLPSAVPLHLVPMKREPHLLHDIQSLLEMIILLRKLRPRAVVMGTPKMALLGMLAASFIRVPTRVYVLHGLRMEGISGPLRWFYTILEWLTNTCATQTIAVSPSLRDAALKARVARPSHISVLGHGSANGIDTLRFSPGTSQQRMAFRQALQIPSHARLVTFVGRVTRDKGLLDLVEIWHSIRHTAEDAWLMIVGADETTSAHEKAALATLLSDKQAKWLPQITDMPAAYRASDVCILPTKREGLGTVLLEASACQLPSVAYKTTGTVDAVQDGVTGYLLAPGDIDGFVGRVTHLLDKPDARRKLGANGRSMVVHKYDKRTVHNHWQSLLCKLPDGRVSTR